MANPGTLPITLVTILLLVAPGFLAIQAFLWVSERNYTLDRTEKIVWSSGASLLSLFVLYVTSPVHFDWMASLGTSLTEDFGIVTQSKLFGAALSTTVVLYLSHLLVLFAGAVLLGRFSGWRADDERDRREPWRYAFDNAGEGWIEVFLENGPHIRGEFDPSAWDSSRKDLYLKNPRSLSNDEPVPLGQSMLIKSEWITGVVFTEDDPNREQMEQFSEEDLGEMEEIMEAISDLEVKNSETTVGQNRDKQGEDGPGNSGDANQEESRNE